MELPAPGFSLAQAFGERSSGWKISLSLSLVNKCILKIPQRVRDERLALCVFHTRLGRLSDPSVMASVSSSSFLGQSRQWGCRVEPGVPMPASPIREPGLRTRHSSNSASCPSSTERPR